MSNAEFINSHYELGGLWFTNDTRRKFAEFIAEAYKGKYRIEVTYKEGWENFSGYHGGNGLIHSFRVGRSTGIYKIPLMLSSSRSIGGEVLLSSKESIHSYRIK